METAVWLGGKVTLYDAANGNRSRAGAGAPAGRSAGRREEGTEDSLRVLAGT